MKKFILLFAIISYPVTAQVTEQWLAVYNGPSGSIDSARNLVVDNEGSIYVTGSSTSSNLLDYTTLKYSPAGDLIWEARYDGPNHFRDDAQWIAIDNSGNVYVTGSSRSGVQAGTEDFATVKYNASGEQQWAAIYNGPEDGPDVAVKVTVDISGNVYVTGYSYGNQIDYLTIKYNSEGVQQWAARYNGTGNSLDFPAALAVDNSGNVFVTGTSRSTSLHLSEDFLTIKYNSDGVEEWVVRYNGPSDLYDASSSMAIDNLGNIYITGSSLSPATQNDYITIKYNSDGIQQWLSSYNNSSFNGSDLARMVIVDLSGSVYVTGTSGTDYPLGYPNYVTIKYNSSGQEQWVSSYNGPGNADDVPYSIAIDDAGNLYVTGKATIPGFFYDIATVKYNNDGNQIWEKRFDGAANMNDGSTWVHVDNSGNVYIAGNSMYYTDYASDIVVLKYQQDSGVPVELSSFTAASINLLVELNWTTVTELNNKGFEIERKQTSATNWETISFVYGNGTTSETHSYSYSDAAVSPGFYSYRLKQIDINGSYKYSNIVDVEVKGIPAEYSLQQNYPNPFNPSTTISYSIPEEGFVSLKVFDVLGKEITTLVNGEMEAGRYSVSFSASNLPSGIYFYKIQSKYFAETRKMILSK